MANSTISYVVILEQLAIQPARKYVGLCGDFRRGTALSWRWLAVRIKAVGEMFSGSFVDFWADNLLVCGFENLVVFCLLHQLFMELLKSAEAQISFR
jgi:hypothetical protein